VSLIGWREFVRGIPIGLQRERQRSATSGNTTARLAGPAGTDGSSGLPRPWMPAIERVIASLTTTTSSGR